MEYEDIALDLIGLLESDESLRSAGSERELQTAIAKALEDRIVGLGQARRLTIKRDWTETGPGTAGVQAVYAFGSDFRPDVTVTGDDILLLAVEVKLAHKSARRGASSHVSSAVGQALIYRELYQYATAYVLNAGLDRPHLHDIDKALADALWERGVRLIVCRPLNEDVVR